MGVALGKIKSMTYKFYKTDVLTTRVLDIPVAHSLSLSTAISAEESVYCSYKPVFD